MPQAGISDTLIRTRNTISQVRFPLDPWTRPHPPTRPPPYARGGKREERVRRVQLGSRFNYGGEIKAEGMDLVRKSPRSG